MIPILVTIFIAIVFYIGYRREKNVEKALIDSIINNSGKATKRKITAEELKAISSYTNYKNDCTIDDITWNDLDMSLIYKSINYCLTSAGDEYLYYILRKPKTSDYDWSGFEEKVEAIRNDSALRKKIVNSLFSMGYTGKCSVYTYLDYLDNLSVWNNTIDIVLDILYVPGIILCFVNGLVGALFIFLLMVINISTYFGKKRKIESYLVCFDYISRILNNCDLLRTVNDVRLDDILTDLDNTSKRLVSIKKQSVLVLGNWGSSPLGIIWDYIKMLTHIDLINFKSMFVFVKGHKEDIIHLLDIVGKIDALVSIGEYRSFLSKYCVPVLDENINGIKIQEGLHPLIKNAIPNSIDTNSSILLTGSNASGKSTFLKMVAVNCILAQTIHTCLADSYEAPYYNLYSSLSLKDNIVAGDSFYMSEIKALKRIIDAAKTNKNVIGFVDEVLKGTNTVERIAASSGILKNLSKDGVMVFAATHDIELTDILDEYTNYHFEENMTDNDISFSYKLLSGKAVTRNAITLLEYLGYDKTIIDKSREYVAQYEKKGTWN